MTTNKTPVLAPTPSTPPPEAPAKPQVVAYCCPRNPNFRKLVKEGKVRQTPDPNSPTGMKDMARIGDVWIEFKNGFWEGGLSEDDDVRIAWCEAQASQDDPLVMSILDPQAQIWYSLKQGQAITGRRDPTVAPGINVSAAMRGEASLVSSSDDPVEAMRRNVEAANAARG